MWQNLAARRSVRASERAPKASTSATIPTGDAAAIDEALSERMNLVRLHRLARPQRPQRRQAEGAPAAGEGRSDPGRHDAPGVARRARRRDRRRAEREAGRVLRRPASSTSSTRSSRTSSCSARSSASCCRRSKQWLGQQSGAELLANIRDNGQIDLTLDGQAIALTARKSKSASSPSPAGPRPMTRRGRRALHRADAGARRRRRRDDVVRLIQDRRKESAANTPTASKSASSPNPPTFAAPSNDSATTSCAETLGRTSSCSSRCQASTVESNWATQLKLFVR